MGLSDKLRGALVGLDATPFIYFIERHPRDLEVLVLEELARQQEESAGGSQG